MKLEGFCRRLDRAAAVIGSLRPSFAAALPLVLLANLYWYGAFLSFPILGDDAASNLSVLLATMRAGAYATLRFPMNWSEGMGQANLFVTFGFDPFAWVLLLPLDLADGYRLSMALRATTAWAASYWFFLLLFRGSRVVALASATLYLLIDFILTSAWGTYVWAGTFNATHGALFPLLAAFALLVMRSRSRVGLADLGFFVTLLFFLLDYPIGSLIGTPVLLTFAGVAMLLARPAERRRAAWGLVKILGMLAILLLAPPLHMLAAWSALTEGAARIVFSNELFSYGKNYLPPLMWTRTPLALRVTILVALSVLLLDRCWPRPLRVLVGTLVLLVGGVQALALMKYLGLDGGLVDRLPRPHYFEFYAPLFYAGCGGTALHLWRDVLFPRLRDGRRVLSWATRAILLSAAALVILPLASIVAFALLLLTATVWARVAWRGERLLATPPVLGMVARCGLAALVAGAVATWLFPTAAIYPIFYAAARCHAGVLWCRDPMGPTMGAADNPITQFLRRELDRGDVFAGRADTLLRPPVRFGLLAGPNLGWTPELFGKLHSWYRRAYEQQVLNSPERDAVLSVAPCHLRADSRSLLLSDLEKFAHSDAPFFGPCQDKLVLEMHDWVSANGAPFKLGATKIVDPWAAINSVQGLSEERGFAYFSTDNGLVQRALPLQGVPVASSYEQSLGYLYYLLWTRYLSAGQAAMKSINTTTLETLHPERLALAGVRYIIARDSLGYEAPALQRVMSWHGYSVYALNHANLAGYGVRTLAYAGSLSRELVVMRTHGFDPRETAVVPESMRPVLGDAADWSPLANSSIALEPDALHFTASSAARPSFVVLPFNWSRCWIPEWSKGVGQVTRADVGLIGIAFEGAIDMRLRWAAGYGAARRCLLDDQALIGAAKEAAAQVNYERAYEPIDEQAPPFATARPFMAADVIEELMLRERPAYRSGDEVVIPQRATRALSTGERENSDWTSAVTTDFHAAGNRYEFAARNDGGESLVVLPQPFSYCWQAQWRGTPGTLLPVQSTRLGVIFRSIASATLSLPHDRSPDCVSHDKARETAVAALEGVDEAHEPPYYALGHKIVFIDTGDGALYTRGGWSQPEGFGTWALGPVARLIIRAAPPATGGLRLDAIVGALLIGSRHQAEAVVAVNGVDVGVWRFALDNTPGPRELLIPRALIEDTGVMVIDFKMPDALSPIELGEPVDKRKLSLSFQALTVTAAGERPPTQ
jgi:hypothetical protein